MMILKTLDLFTDYNLKIKEFTGVTKTVGERKKWIIKPQELWIVHYFLETRSREVCGKYPKFSLKNLFCKNYEVAETI